MKINFLLCINGYKIKIVLRVEKLKNYQFHKIKLQMLENVDIILSSN